MNNINPMPRMKVSRSTAPAPYKIGNERELMVFRLKLWNRSDCDLYDLVLRLYDVDHNEMVAAFPIAVCFKSRRERNEAELFTPFKNEFKIPSHVRNIEFKVEHLKPLAVNNFHTEFEVKFDLF